MTKTFVGRKRTETLDWLLNVWLKNGPPICFLQGFPGVGKTDLARDFRALVEKQGNWNKAVINEIADRATPSVIESLMELSVSLSNQGLPGMEMVLFGQGNPDLGYAVEKALQRPVLIILDEAQRFFVRSSGTPLPEMKEIFAYLRNRPNLRGRLLLLSDRVVEQARWSEWIPIRTLPELTSDEAIQALEIKIREAGIDAELAPNRRHEIVRDLNFNPRAIEALVGALRYETIDEIIESNPGLWAVRDREISSEFLAALERDLLERTMRHLGAPLQQKLRWLAVHRRSFKRPALEQLCSDEEEESQFRTMLVDRFLANFYRGDFSLNPIVREISLAHLREDQGEFRQAHSRAADYHLRHFRAKQIVEKDSKLGEAFAELRYHLTLARRQDELLEVGHRFTDHLKRQIKVTTPPPADREELDERIGVLTVLLETGGSKALEFHLARCLHARGKPGDLQKAFRHAELSTGSSAPEESWLFFSKLTLQVKGVEPAIAVIRRGLATLKDSAPLYQLGAEVLISAGKNEAAVDLLKEGIGIVPPGKNLVSLYQRCGELLVNEGEIGDAIQLLRDGIKVIPPDKGLFSLYQTLGTVYCRAGQGKRAVASHLEGIHRISDGLNSYKLVEAALFLAAALDDSATMDELISSGQALTLGAPQVALGNVLQHQMQGDWQKAADNARAARLVHEHYFRLAIHESFSLLAVGDAEGAWRALVSFPKLTFGVGEPHGWLAAFIHLRRGRPSDASSALGRFLGRKVDERSELNVQFLLRLWDEQIAPPRDRQICFYFPIVPPSLTGLGLPARRVPFSRSILPVNLAMPARPAGPAIREQAYPSVFVSYAWGEDATDDGKRREEIVNRLCEAAATNGHQIGRDKDRMRGGDSIEKFADEISRAKRIVAVISEKSLHSKFCMAHELFIAYRRCNYRRIEFQERVIALVMADAQKYLKDEFAIIMLTKHWKESLDTLRANFESVDPRGKSRDMWAEIDLLDEMVSHLPGMLGALNDIAMKRGFEAIVADGFREVLDRLPPKEAAPFTPDGNTAAWAPAPAARRN